jgi:hypothetical protein
MPRGQLYASRSWRPRPRYAGLVLRLSVAFFVVAVGTKVVAYAGPLMTAPADGPSARVPHDRQPALAEEPAPSARPRTGARDAQAAVRAAATVGHSGGFRVAVAVLDRRSGAVYAAGDDAAYPSASVVKVFVAARLLVNGRDRDPATEDLMRKMIVASDDNAATALYPLAGGEGLAAWINQRYGTRGIRASTKPGAWYLTRVTARAVVTFYSAIADDDLVRPWLLDAMEETQANGSDGFAQYFGIPQATTGWRIKQGWMCCVDDRSYVHSTGFVNDDRYAVAILTEGSRDTYDSLSRTVSEMARALMPGGSIPPPRRSG